MDCCLPFPNQFLRWSVAKFSHDRFDLKNRAPQYQNIRVNIFCNRSAATRIAVSRAEERPPPR